MPSKIVRAQIGCQPFTIGCPLSSFVVLLWRGEFRVRSQTDSSKIETELPLFSKDVHHTISFLAVRKEDVTIKSRFYGILIGCQIYEYNSKTITKSHNLMYWYLAWHLLLIPLFQYITVLKCSALLCQTVKWSALLCHTWHFPPIELFPRKPKVSCLKKNIIFCWENKS